MGMKKILVAMSGGVDSAGAALLLKRAGYDVAGVTMLLYDKGDGFKDAKDAKAVCDALGVEHFTLDCTEAFRLEVIDRFIREYEAGLTPNPCLFCNKRLKFGVLLDEAKARGFDGIATGHYANVAQKSDGTVRLFRAKSLAKDQTYVLYSLSREVLQKTLFPLGEVESKDALRALVEEAGLPVARKGDSQDICFLPQGDYADFIERTTGHVFPAGNYIDKNGTPLGRHAGIHRYTVGQRKGLGVALGEPMYVVTKSVPDNTVTLGRNEDLFSSVFEVTDLSPLTPTGTFRADVRVRYKAGPALGTVEVHDGGTATVTLDTPARAVTPGQAAVFYDGDTLIGGGTIR